MTKRGSERRSGLALCVIETQNPRQTDFRFQVRSSSVEGRGTGGEVLSISPRHSNHDTLFPPRPPTPTLDTRHSTLGTRHSVLLSEMREGGAQRGAGDCNHSIVGRVHLQDQEDCTRDRQRGDEQA
jgi:hypothetical protein